MDYTVLNNADLPGDGSTYWLQGYLVEDTDVCLIWVDMPPGERVRLHRHPYKEVFIIQDGVSTFVVGESVLEARAGQIVIVAAGVAHGFTNSGDGQLRQLDIHLAKKFITEWLED